MLLQQQRASFTIEMIRCNFHQGLWPENHNSDPVGAAPHDNRFTLSCSQHNAADRLAPAAAVTQTMSPCNKEARDSPQTRLGMRKKKKIKKK